MLNAWMFQNVQQQALLRGSKSSFPAESSPVLGPQLSVNRRLGWLWAPSAWGLTSSIFRSLWRPPLFILQVPWGCHHEAPSPNHRHGGSVTLSGRFPCITPQHGALSRDMCETPHRGSPSEKEAEQGRQVTSLEPLYPAVLEVPSRISVSAWTALALFVSASVQVGIL